MLWWVGSGLIVVWLILFFVHPNGWIHLLLIGGITLLVVQTAAYRKTKSVRKFRD
jgi:energy-converting hydrogenase Eha subunit G